MGELAISSAVAAAERAIGARLASGDLKLPLLPSAVGEVLSLSMDDKSDAARLATVVQQDQTLATHMLRVVNSPIYRGTQEIVALKQAIARLGLDRVREIALAVSLAGTLFKSERYQDIADHCWHVALAAALWGKEIARTCRTNVETAYLCGLLHNLGAPLVLQCVSELDAAPEPDTVRTLIDTFTSQAGVSLAEQWGLPPTVVATIAHFADFRTAQGMQDEVATAVAGARIAQLNLDDALETDAVSSLDEIQHLNLYPEDVQTLLEQREAIGNALELLTV